MKVVIFSRYPKDSSRPKGGVESVTVVLVKALAQFDDLEVHLVALEKDRTQTDVSQDGDVTVHRLPGNNWPQVFDIVAGPGRKKLVNYIRLLKPDILHAHETYGLTLGRISIPYVFTVHGFDHANLIADAAKYGWLRSQLWKLVQWRGLATQKNIISISPYVRNMVTPYTNANIYDIDNPVDERFFKISSRPEPGRILCVGWINERKNTLGSIKAFASICNKYEEAKLVIAGEQQETDYFNQVKQSIEQYGIADKVELLGHINHARLEQELARASIFLLPSRQENSPMAIAEALAAGIPAIASNRCGMPYMIEEGKTGFLIDPESTEHISQCLNQLVGSQQLCHKMGQAGHQAAMDRFHPNVVALRTKGVYEHIFESRNRRRH